jgi:hypothetical protein
MELLGIRSSESASCPIERHDESCKPGYGALVDVNAYDDRTTRGA